MKNIVETPKKQMGWGLFNDDFDNLFEGFFRPMRPFSEMESGGMIPSVDVKEDDDGYTVKADLPGVKKEDIDVSLQDGLLTINAETKMEKEDKEKGRVIRQERRYGKFVRSMRLGTGINEAKVKASYKDGVLELKLPKSEEVKPKKISVNVS
ncbi:Hsp20/alpha crystallin family protein [Pseudomonadota bacterium]